MGLFLKSGKMGKESKPHAPRNSELGTSGVKRFSRSAMNKKTGSFRKTLKKVAPQKAAKRPARMVQKEIGGDNNGEKRTVRASRLPRFYPTEDRPRKLRTRKNNFSQHKRNLRPSITPGTVLILLAGRHKGKRVVFLKQLGTGLLLVTGPYKLNGCPLRRVNQIYVIATKTKLDISKVELPERLNDDYFRRTKLRKPKHTEGEIFETKKEAYAASEERKEDQVKVDGQILTAVRENDEKKYLFGYLGARFALKNHQYPHQMIF